VYLIEDTWLPLLTSFKAQMQQPRFLETPDSASGRARRLKVARQLVYHLKELESAGLVEVVEERKKGNCIERILRAKRDRT
jgi:hypothetical protein